MSVIATQPAPRCFPPQMCSDSRSFHTFCSNCIAARAALAYPPHAILRPLHRCPPPLAAGPPRREAFRCLSCPLCYCASAAGTNAAAAPFGCLSQACFPLVLPSSVGACVIKAMCVCMPPCLSLSNRAGPLTTPALRAPCHPLLSPLFSPSAAPAPSTSPKF